MEFCTQKVIEFQVVIIPHIHTLVDEGIADEGFGTERRRKLFTAMTRAFVNLTLTYSGAFPKQKKAKPFEKR